MIRALFRLNNRLISTIALLLCAISMNAQSVSYGSTYVHGGGELTVNIIKHNFMTGSGLILPGNVATKRSQTRGYFSFANGGTYIAASNSNHVDGYSRTYNNDFFIFPIGDNGQFLPCAVNASSATNPIDAAYYNVDPTIAITSKVGGGNEIVLPEGGPFNSAAVGPGISQVSLVEYWDINGNTNANISLVWNKNSDVNFITGGKLHKLTIVGWDGTKWVKIDSKVDSFSFMNYESSFLRGSITTNLALTPSTYNVYTFANGCVPVSGTPIITCIDPASSCDTVCNLLSSKKFKVTGMTNTSGYLWTTTNGATVISGQGNDTVEIDFSTGTSGLAQICVTPYNYCDTQLVPTCKDIQVIPTPVITVGGGPDQLICLGNPLNISALPGAGIVYTWKLPNGSTSNANPLIISTTTYADSGDYIMTKSAYGCTSPIKDTIHVSMIPGLGLAFNSTPTTPICETETKILTASPSGGTWSIISGGGSISGNIYTPSNIDTNTPVRIRYTVPATASCPETYSTSTFVVHPSSTIVNSTVTTPICELSSRTLSATPAGGTWSIISGPGSIVGNVYTSPEVNSTSSVVIRYNIASVNVCPSLTSDITFTIININNTDPVVTLPSTGGTKVADLTAYICVNGSPVVLGNKSSTVKSSGIWPDGISIDSNGKVTVKSGTRVGSYPVQIILCDSVKPIPNCKLDTLIVIVTPVIDPKNDTATVNAGDIIAVNNIAINDSVNGAKAILGVNAIVSQSGTWPANIVLNQSTGQVTLTGPVPSGTYVLNYTLCDSFKPRPNCKDAQIILKVFGIRPDTIVVFVTRYDTIIKLCTTRDDINNYKPPYTFKGGPAPKGYKVVGPDANGCYTYQPDSLFVFEENSSTYTVICAGGVCDTTYFIFVPAFDKWVIPNYISPNGDGVNDAWVIPDIIYLKYPNVSVSIYNRWGNTVWRSTGKYMNNWKGQREGSQEEVPDGVYYYLLELDPYFKTTKSGFIEVMR